MPAQSKLDYAQALEQKLQDKNHFILTSYQGLSVTQMEELRRQLEPHATHLQIIKNRLFGRALSASEVHTKIASQLKPQLRGPLMVVFVEKGFPETGKKILAFAKDAENVVIKSGFFDGKLLDAFQVAEIARLPSQKELQVIIARGLMAPVTQIALGAKGILRRVAVGISAIAKARKS